MSCVVAGGGKRYVRRQFVTTRHGPSTARSRDPSTPRLASGCGPLSQRLQCRRSSTTAAATTFRRTSNQRSVISSFSLKLKERNNLNFLFKSRRCRRRFQLRSESFPWFVWSFIDVVARLVIATTAATAATEWPTFAFHVPVCSWQSVATRCSVVSTSVSCLSSSHTTTASC